MGANNALRGKTKVESLFIGINAFENANNWSECYQFPSVWLYLYVFIKKQKTLNCINHEKHIQTPTFFSVSFCREKLPQYDIDISFMFEIDQQNCERNVKNETYFQ